MAEDTSTAYTFRQCFAAWGANTPVPAPMSMTALFRVQFEKFYDRIAILLVVAKPLVHIIVLLHLLYACVVYAGLFHLVVRPFWNLQHIYSTIILFNQLFYGAHLDPTIQTFVVTDFYSIYPGVFGKFFGENLIHQLRLMHLSKLIVGVVKLQLQGGAAETVRWEFHARMVEWES